MIFSPPISAMETPLRGPISRGVDQTSVAAQSAKFPGFRVRPLGTVHVSAFHYDERVRYMLSVAFLLAYEGGEIQPGDDMAGSEFRWWSLDEIASEDVELIIPPGGKWLLARAVDLYRLWSQADAANQPGFDLTVRGKTKK